MDKSFLSKRAVIEASRGFVCVRLATYEDAAEGAFLKSLFRTRSGELENSVFAILQPDGRSRIGRAGRSPSMIYRDAEAMASDLERIAARYRPKPAAWALPYAADLRRGLVIAASDIQPLIVVRASGATARRKLEAALRQQAWREPLIGRCAYASTQRSLGKISGAPRGDAILLVEPDAYGLAGEVVASCSVSQLEGLAERLREGLARIKLQGKDSSRHIRAGRRSGQLWETVIPVTDPGGRHRR